MTRARTDDLSSALDHLERGDWRAAHEIVQRDEDGALACWAHGIVHLMEGDASNARYWYRRAGRAFPVQARVDAELKALRAALDATHG
jgi:hypothetical protein